MYVIAPLKPLARRASVQRVKSAATRAALIAAARDRFGEAGYHETGTHNLVSLASVTRGALYHHFGDKRDLFEAVFLQTDEDLNRAARSAVAPLAGDIWRQLLAALAAYLRLRAENRDAQRILLIDGPAVLGWARWRELQVGSLHGIVQTLLMLMDQSVIVRGSPETLAQLIFAAMNEAALSIAHAADPRAALSAHTDSLLALVKGLRVIPDMQV
jgi:AcrR family transcriptional regulator